MAILELCDPVKHCKFVIFKLQKAKISALKHSLSGKYRMCYISKKELADAIAKGNSSESVINSVIPDPGSVRSGEFGEIFSYFLVKEMYASKPINGPKKWRLKEDRNKAVLKTDLVLYNVNHPPSPQDLLVSAEIKTKATKNSKYNPIKDAVEGAELDSTSRLAKTLLWLRDKATRQGKLDSVATMDRFIYSINDKFGPYIKHIKAIAIIDSNLIDAEIANNANLAISSGIHEVIVLSIEDLRDYYTDIYETIPKSI